MSWISIVLIIVFVAIVIGLLIWVFMKPSSSSSNGNGVSNGTQTCVTGISARRVPFSECQFKVRPANILVNRIEYIDIPEQPFVSLTPEVLMPGQGYTSLQLGYSLNQPLGANQAIVWQVMDTTGKQLANGSVTTQYTQFGTICTPIRFHTGTGPVSFQVRMTIDGCPSNPVASEIQV